MDAGAGEEEEGEHGTTPAGEEEVPEQECSVTTSKKKLENKDGEYRCMYLAVVA